MLQGYIASGLNPCHALLFLCLPLMGRGQEALNRLFLPAEKFLGNSNPPAAHCKHQHLPTNLPQDRTPQHAEDREIAALTTQPSPGPAWPACILGSAQRSPAAGHPSESPRWALSDTPGLEFPWMVVDTGGYQQHPQCHGQGHGWPVPGLTCCSPPGSARFYPGPFRRGLCGSRGA